MINTSCPTNTQRNTQELFEFFIYSLFLKEGKEEQANKKASTFISTLPHRDLIYAANFSSSELRKQITEALKKAKTGNYTLYTNAIAFLALKLAEDSLYFNSNFLMNASLEDLLQIPGMNDLSARFFLIHTRENQEHAILDKKVFQWLSLFQTTPKRTPKGSQYILWEKKYLEFIKSYGTKLLESRSMLCQEKRAA